MKISARAGLATSLGLVAGMAVVLWLMGRNLICKCGTVKLWHGVVISSENSQHIADWYTPSHLLHGLIFYMLFWWLLPKVSFGGRLVLATLLEITWEIVENTDAVIQRYREATIALDYYGDSVLNSVSDCLAMIAGFYLARVLPVWASVLLFFVFELGVAYAIRDGLTLNVLMLLWPLDAVKEWQTG